MNGYRICFNDPCYSSDMSEHEFLLGIYTAWILFSIEVVHKWVGKERRQL